jgi:hypothetical protein
MSTGVKSTDENRALTAELIRVGLESRALGNRVVDELHPVAGHRGAPRRSILISPADPSSAPTPRQDCRDRRGRTGDPKNINELDQAKNHDGTAHQPNLSPTIDAPNPPP